MIWKVLGRILKHPENTPNYAHFYPPKTHPIRRVFWNMVMRMPRGTTKQQFIRRNHPLPLRERKEVQRMLSGKGYWCGCESCP